MKLRNTAFGLASFGFVFDSFALGLEKAHPQLLQTVWAGPMSAYVATMMHLMSLPVLILIYLGTICDILVVDRVSRYLLVRIRQSSLYRERLSHKRPNVKPIHRS